MNIIADNRDIILFAKLQQLLQLFLLPYPSYGIMRIAQQQNARLCTLFFHILKIYMIISFILQQLTAEQSALIVLNDLVEGIIGRCKKENAVLRITA